MTLTDHKIPWKMRPIMPCCGIFMNFWSKWLDHYFQKLKHFVPTHISSTSQLLNWVRNIKDLPPYAFVFTADAGSMYNNIDTEQAIKYIGEWLDKISVHPDFSLNFPLEAVKSTVSTIIKNNVIEFGESWMGKYAHQVPELNIIYLQQALNYFLNKLARFCMTLTAHKIPWKMRPIVPCCGVA